MGDWKILLLILCISGILLTLGIVEKIQNKRYREKLKVRVNVNGIRGKSTITRMITAILQEEGYHVVGKTTGTAARMFYWDQEEEEIITRKPKGVSIGEQIQVIKKAAKYGADALVCECMAVRPDYQKAYQQQILDGNIYCIVNVLEDHLDEMGPTLNQIAWAFADAMPYNATAIIPNCEFTDYFLNIARKKNTKAIIADPSEISEEYLSQFDYRVFPNNCAVPLAVAKALGISKERALSAMLKARPDPGATRVKELKNESLHTWFINAFAANEPSSTLEIWDLLRKEGKVKEGAVVVMNCRPDRVDRTEQFAKDCFPYMGGIHLFVIGEKGQAVKKEYQKGKLKNLLSYHNLENESVDRIMTELVPFLNDQYVMGVGNIHGIGGDFIHALEALDQPVPDFVVAESK